MLQKYTKLVDLLNQKVDQLSRKLHHTQEELICSQEEVKTTCSPIKKTESLKSNNFELGRRFSAPPLQETGTKVSKKEEEGKSEMGSNSCGFWRGGILVNSLTEEVLKLKLNFMHVRQCLYSLFQEAKLWGYIQKSETGKSVAMVLFHVFEYSEQER